MVEAPELEQVAGKNNEACTVVELELELERKFQIIEAVESNSSGHKVHWERQLEWGIPRGLAGRHFVPD